MPIPLGILAAAGFRPPAAGGSYDLIETVALSSSASSVEFTGLGAYSTIYKSFQIRYTAKTNWGSFADDGVLMQFNGDATTTNYKSHILAGGGSSGLQSGVYSTVDWYGSRAVGAAASNLTANIFASGVIDILDPYAAKNKTSRTLSGFFESATAINSYSACRISLSSHLWMNTASVTSISLFPPGSRSFVSGTRFSIYGVK